METQRTGARRGRPPKVSAKRILDAVEAKTEFSWTMAGIAAELGVTEAALYYHFPGKQALLVAAGARVMSQVSEPDYAQPWQQWLAAYAEDVFDSTVRHPFLQDVDMAFAAASSATNLRRGEAMLEALTGAGFSTRNAVLAIQLITTAAHQFAIALGRYDGTHIRAQQAELSLLASHAGTPLAAVVYADPETWDVHATAREFLRVTLSGIAAELGPKPAPAPRRGRSS